MHNTLLQTPKLIIATTLLCLITALPSLARTTADSTTAYRVRKNYWYIGTQGGATENFLLSNIANRQYQVYKPGYGFYGGLLVQCMHAYTRRWALSVRISPSVLSKPYNLVRTDNNPLLNQYTRNDYVQLPLTVSCVLRAGRRWRFSAGAGGYAGYWAYSYISGGFESFLSTYSYTPYHQAYTFDTRRDARMEYGLTATASVAYRLGRGWTVFAQADGYQSETDQQKKYMGQQTPRFNRTYVFSPGILKKI